MLNEVEAQKTMNTINKKEKASLATCEDVIKYSHMGEIFNQAKIEVKAGKVTKKVWENVNQKYPNVAFNAVLKDSALNYLISNFLFCYENEKELIQFLKDSKKQVKMDNLRRVYARHTRVIETEAVTSDTQTATSGKEPEAKNADNSLTAKVDKIIQLAIESTVGTDNSATELLETALRVLKQPPAQRALNRTK